MVGRTLLSKIKLLNSSDYMTLMDEQSLNSGGSLIDWTSYKSIYDANGNVNNTNWMDQMFKDNAVQQNVIGVTGGSKTNTFAISTGYYDRKVSSAVETPATTTVIMFVVCLSRNFMEIS